MRLAPVPMWCCNHPAAAMEYAGQSSRTTHGAPAAVDACRSLGGLLVGAINGARKDALLAPFYSPVAGYWDWHPLHPDIAAIAAGSYRHKDPPAIRGTGYVVASLEAALWAFARTENFRDGCICAVNLGEDVDTTGAVYGQADRKNKSPFGAGTPATRPPSAPRRWPPLAHPAARAPGACGAPCTLRQPRWSGAQQGAARREPGHHQARRRRSVDQSRQRWRARIWRTQVSRRSSPRRAAGRAGGRGRRAGRPPAVRRGRWRGMLERAGPARPIREGWREKAVVE
jgi:ADP-ribosylglycohydrolase